MTTPPTPREDLRVGDREREQMANRLIRAHGLGQLTLEEFEERVTQTYAAQTRGDLALVDADLPISTEPPSGSELENASRREGVGSPWQGSRSAEVIQRSRSAKGRKWYPPVRRGGWSDLPAVVKIALVMLAIWLVLRVSFGIVGVVMMSFWPVLLVGGVTYCLSRERRAP